MKRGNREREVEGSSDSFLQNGYAYPGLCDMAAVPWCNSRDTSQGVVPSSVVEHASACCHAQLSKICICGRL